MVRAGAGGTTKTQFRPPFGPVIDISIDERFGLALRLAAYVNDVLCIHLLILS